MNDEPIQNVLEAMYNAALQLCEKDKGDQDEAALNKLRDQAEELTKHATETLNEQMKSVRQLRQNLKDAAKLFTEAKTMLENQSNLSATEPSQANALLKAAENAGMQASEATQNTFEIFERVYQSKVNAENAVSQVESAASLHDAQTTFQAKIQVIVEQVEAATAEASNLEAQQKVDNALNKAQAAFDFVNNTFLLYSIRQNTPNDNKHLQLLLEHAKQLQHGNETTDQQRTSFSSFLAAIENYVTDLNNEAKCLQVVEAFGELAKSYEPVTAESKAD